MTTYLKGDETSPCMTCRGTGREDGAKIGYGPVYESSLPCMMCGGTGRKSVVILDKGAGR